MKIENHNLGHQTQRIIKHIVEIIIELKSLQ
jgi:hypothetical protein